MHHCLPYNLPQSCFFYGLSQICIIQFLSPWSGFLETLIVTQLVKKFSPRFRYCVSQKLTTRPSPEPTESSSDLQAPQV
jgi:hypothetical protein